MSGVLGRLRALPSALIARLRRDRRAMGVAIALAASAAGVLLLAAWRSHLVAPAPTLLLQDRHGRFLGEIGDGSDADQGYWPLERVPERVAAATLAIEDRRFWSHPGVDPFAAVRALRQNLGSGRRISGASTLAMQVARMQHPGHRHLARKAVEAVSALLITARHGREAIKAVVDPPLAQVVWYVDGHPWETVPRPYATRWPLRQGPHVFQARLSVGGPASQAVRVLVE